MKVRLTIEQTEGGLRATIRQRDERRGSTSDQVETFPVESMDQAKRRAAGVARRHGLKSYGLVDKT
jgi:hypothetical protein